MNAPSMFVKRILVAEIHWSRFVTTPLIGIIGGILASYAHWPLPWMVGSLVAVILVKCCGPWQIAPLPGGRKAGQWVVGLGIGLHFNAAVIEQILNYSIPIVAGAIITTMVSAIAVWLMRSSGHDRATAFFSSMPGGAAEMVNLGQRNGALLSQVAAAQSLRVVIVVLTVPAAFKFFMGEGVAVASHSEVSYYWLLVLFPLGGVAGWLLQYMRQPNPWMFGSIFVSACASVWFDLHLALPTGASQFGQLMIGSSLGCFFERSFFRDAPGFLARSFLSTCLMIIIAGAAAAGLGWLTWLDFRSLTLGMMPGGIAEMSLTAETLQLSVPLVTAMQTLRLVLVLFLAEPLFRYWQRKDKAKTQ
jgi:membrane AbrB-like protein